MNELEAAHLMLAGLDMLSSRAPIESEAHSLYVVQRTQWVNLMERLESAAPPWEPEPAESVTLPWSRVACGDSVQAPNGTWYAVDAVARIGERMRVHLLLDAARIESTPKASDPVPVRRGPAGQAMDIFTAGGLELTLITSGVAA